MQSWNRLPVLLRYLYVEPKGNARLMCAIVRKLRDKLDEGATNPTYIFTESGVGYRMLEGGTPSACTDTVVTVGYTHVTVVNTALQSSGA